MGPRLLWPLQSSLQTLYAHSLLENKLFWSFQWVLLGSLGFSSPSDVPCFPLSCKGVGTSRSYSCKWLLLTHSYFVAYGNALSPTVEDYPHGCLALLCYFLFLFIGCFEEIKKLCHFSCYLPRIPPNWVLDPNGPSYTKKAHPISVMAPPSTTNTKWNLRITHTAPFPSPVVSNLSRPTDFLASMLEPFFQWKICAMLCGFPATPFSHLGIISHYVPISRSRSWLLNFSSSHGIYSMAIKCTYLRFYY